MEVEKSGYNYNREDELAPQAHSPSFLSDAICYNACKLAKDVNADALIGMTQSGYTGCGRGRRWSQPAWHRCCQRLREWNGSEA